MPKLLRINDRFEISSPDDANGFIGQGGMGAVYRGFDRQTSQPVAIKMLRADLLAREPESLERFQREAEALRQLNHPNIVKMLDMVQRDSVHYLIMELVEGGSLRDLLDREPRLPIARALNIALDLADALTRAHRLNILHRDIKPGNVLIAADGTPRLTDFGMARIGKNQHITADGAIVGTLAYLSPEALQGLELDERSDIWAFGVMLFEMLTGERPFPYVQTGALINAILSYPIPELETLRLDLPTGLVDLIYRMLAKDVQSRIPSVRLVGAALEAVLRDDSGKREPGLLPSSAGRFGTPTPQPISGQAVRSKLPTPPTPFVGRYRELEDLSALFRRAETRLLTLVGPGGIGKTRLALAAAETLVGQTRDGVFFVALEGVQQLERLLKAIAESLDFQFGGGEHQAELFQYLREKSLLLVLDNYEQFPEGARFIADLLETAPRLRCLVSSRERLRLRSEHVYEVSSMVLPTARDTMPERLLEFPIVQLFDQSARRVVPDFQINPANAGTIIEICRLVEGLPLGVELAAAWLENLTLEEILHEIGKSLDFLETDLHDVPERHRSLRAVFQSSWDLLSAEERETFAAVAVFHGGFERDAAQSITGATLRILTSLVNKSLLQRGASGRYSMLKPLRRYAEEKLNSVPQTREATLEAHARHYLTLMANLQANLSGSKEQQALDLAELEFENVHSAFEYARQKQRWDWLDSALDALTLYYLGRSMLSEGHADFTALLAALNAAGQNGSRLYWRVIVRQNWLAGRLGGYEAVIAPCEAAYQYFSSQNDAVEAAHALNQISYALMMLGRYGDARDYAAAAIEAIGDMSDVVAWFMGMGNLGYAEYLMGNYQEARYVYESVEHAAQTTSYSASGVAYNKNNLGEILREMGEIEGARRLFREALAIFRSIHNRRGIAFTLNNLGGVAFSAGDLKEATRLYEESHRINREIGDLFGIGHSLAALGNLASMEGDERLARSYFEESLKIRRKAGDQRGTADSLMDVARLELNAGNLSTAERILSDVVRLRQKIGDRYGEGLALASLAIAVLMQERYEEAEAHIRSAFSIGEAIGNPLVRSQGLLGLGISALHHGNLDEAEQHLREAIRVSREGGKSLTILSMALCKLGEIQLASGDAAQAMLIASVVQRESHAYLNFVQKAVEDLAERATVQLSAAEIKRIQQRARNTSVEVLAETYLV